MISRINFYGGPGVGKSTLAAKFFVHLKRRGHNVELIPEFVKQYVYTKQTLTPWGQVYMFGQQFGAELRVLEGGVQQLVTDSPLLLQATYARYNGCPSYEQLIEISLEFETDYPSVNFLVLRTVPFASTGRWQDEDGGKVWDRLVEQDLDLNNVDYYIINPLDDEAIDKHLKVVENL